MAHIELTQVFVQDPKTERFTAFFAQLPNIIAEGDNEDEATMNLLETVQTVFAYQKNTEVEYAKLHSIGGTVTTKPLNLAFA
jgi:predicted RNase H-like HicB family nuclease